MPVEIFLRQRDVPEVGSSISVPLAKIPESTGTYALVTGEEVAVTFDMTTKPQRVTLDGLKDPVLTGRRERIVRTAQFSHTGIAVHDLGDANELVVNLGRALNPHSKNTTNKERRSQRKQERIEREELLRARNAVRIEPARRGDGFVYLHEIIDRSELRVREVVADRYFMNQLRTGVDRKLQFEPYPYADEPQFDFEGNALDQDHLRIRTHLPADEGERVQFAVLVSETLAFETIISATDTSADGKKKAIEDFVDSRLQQHTPSATT
ncbi:MAG: hypothetical protein HY426_05085 [Candidatus Levybacteria bacterium]|nr:hypothetical protein [Candidatus Levybacteria bacterium]